MLGMPGTSTGENTMVTKTKPKPPKDQIQDNDEEQEEPKHIEKGFQDESEQYYHGTEFRRMVERRK
jgi:hypothetical protein